MSTMPQTARESALPRQIHDYYLAMGVKVHIHHDLMRMEHVISAVAENGASISKRVPDNLDSTLMQMVLRGCVDEVMRNTEKNNKQDQLRFLEDELNKYKNIVKRQAYDLEMASGTPQKKPVVLVDKEVRRIALEQAAEFLMDYGVVKTGPELEQVCEQIKKLGMTKAVVMETAAAKMEAAFGVKT